MRKSGEHCSSLALSPESTTVEESIMEYFPKAANRYEMEEGSKRGRRKMFDIVQSQNPSIYLASHCMIDCKKNNSLTFFLRHWRLN